MTYKSWFEWGETLVPQAIPRKEFYKIGDIAQYLEVKPYVLRYWETEFSILSPQKTGGNQRVYRYRDMVAAFVIRHLLYVEKFSIEGARNKIKNYRHEKLDNEENTSEDSPIQVSKTENTETFKLDAPSTFQNQPKINSAIKIIDEMISLVTSL